MNKDKFVPVDGYPGLYVNRNGLFKLPNGDIKKGNLNKKSGYLRIDYHIKGQTRKTLSCHSIVAHMFIPNPNHYSTVDHIDMDKTNNDVDNLRWASRKMQNSFKDQEDKNVFSHKGEYRKKTPVIQKDKVTGEVVKIWSCAFEAARDERFNQTNLYDCLKRRRKSHAGYVWEYVK